MKNGEKTAGKGDRKRDNKGRFAPGSPGGPGRGHKGQGLKSDPDLLDDIQQISQGLMDEKDPKNKATGATIALKVRALRKQEQEPENLSAPEAKLAREVLRDYIDQGRSKALEGLDLGLDDYDGKGGGKHADNSKSA